MRFPRPQTPQQALRLVAAVLVTAVVLLLSSLGSDGRAVPAYHHYVALGDSFTAAPFVPLTDVAYGCLRSTNNYPHQLANALQIDDFVDHSCTGANTSDMTGSQVTARGMSVPPQLRGLGPRTDLVTIGLGFNNSHLYARMNTVCRRTDKVCPLYDQRATLTSIVDQVRPALDGTLEAIKERAPHARILLVSYPKLLPQRGSCPQLPNFRPVDRATLRAINLELRREMAQAARDAGVEFVDYYRYSVGHDICARHPWIQGKIGSRYHGAALHPLAAGQRAVARLIESVLRHPPPAGDR